MSDTSRIDVGANRSARKWSHREQFGRVLWALAQPLFRFSPRPLWGWRRMLLRIFGATVAANVHVHPTARITIPWKIDLRQECAVGDNVILYALGPISIRERATVSQGAHLCAGTHDIKDASRPLIKLPIIVSQDAWIAADAFVGPGVTVGPGAVVGARAVVMTDVAEGHIVVGNPARVLKKENT